MREDIRQAWSQADGTVQLVEYLMRGHAACVPGTLWQEYSKSSSSSTTNPLDSLNTMTQLLDRVMEEGDFYMQVRKQHLSQVAESSDQSWESSDDNNNIAQDWKTFSGSRGDDEDDDFSSQSRREEDEDDQQQPQRSKKSQDMDDDEQEEEEVDVMYDFALPGPTVAMYDTLLDTIAVTAGQAQDVANLKHADLATVVSSKGAFAILEMILLRHRLDGDDEFNDNIHTMPTQQSFNAVLRTVANLPYTKGASSETQRDWALMSAFSTMDCMMHSPLELNSSSYAYLLQVLAKYMPACTSRGNIAHALWTQAKMNGVYNDQVQAAFQAAQSPSNSSNHEEWMEANINNKDWRYDAPQRWRRRVKKFRYDPKQNKY